VVVAVPVVHVMQMAVDDVIEVIAVRDGVVAAAGAVTEAGRVADAEFRRP
jgi:hypothetical protein